jgi:hypothetical protein
MDKKFEKLLFYPISVNIWNFFTGPSLMDVGWEVDYDITILSNLVIVY